jgi:Xaa-Pro aminopeptidase
MTAAIKKEIEEKEKRVRSLLAEKGLEALILKRQANFSWFTAGGLNQVGITTEMGATALLITTREKYVLSNNIESARMMEEEGLAGQGYLLMSWPWYEEGEGALVREIVGSGRLGGDVPYPGAETVTDEVTRLRYSLTEEERQRYAWLGERASLALEETMMAVRPGEKESEVVGHLLRRLWADRIDAITLMSAADERISCYRHPIPTEKKIERILMVSVNARKGGQIVSFTRFVHFGRLPRELLAKYEANVEIDCVFMANTRPGMPVREVLQKGLEAYAKAGYPEEWRHHHQGGAIGYQGRDYRVNLESREVVAENQPFTWNPSLTGTKSEDTILAKSSGVELVTKPVIYPTLSLEVAGISFIRPAILEK